MTNDALFAEMAALIRRVADYGCYKNIEGSTQEPCGRCHSCVARVIVAKLDGAE